MEDIFLYLAPDKGGLGGLLSLSKSEDKTKKVGKPISYVKLNAADFTDPNPKL